jgi:hypothetical protein
MSDFVALIALSLATFAVWGVGIAIQRLGPGKPSTQPAAIGIGLAVIIFAGGFINLAHIAYAPALWVIAGIALAVGLVEVFRLKLKLSNAFAENLEIITAGLVVVGVTVFAISTQLPPRAFNFHDDFQKYFAHPVRMLETGTLAGSTLSALGSETLGAQAYLHGYVLSVLPIGYINSVDAVFGLFALMLVAAAVGRRRFLWFPGAVLGPLLIATINPQYINISGLYIGSLLMATAIVLVANDRDNTPPAPFILGLIYAALVADKSTFALFVVLHLPLSVLALRGTLGSWKEGCKWGARVALWAGVGLLPWVTLYLPNYLEHGALPRASVPSGNDGVLNLLSRQPLTYGASFLHYTAIILVTAALAVAALISVRKTSTLEEMRRPLGLFAGATTGVFSFLIVVVVLGRALNGYETNLRYAIPFILGTCVITICMAAEALPKLPRQLSTHVPLLSGLLIAASFLPAMRERYMQARQSGSILAFSRLARLPDYLTYNQYCLSDGARQYILGLQAKVPQGEPLVAWINTPFLLDYKRNKIIDADTMGISSPWARIPNNVHYMLWQYKGFGVRTEGNYIQDMQGAGAHERHIAAQALQFAKYLAQQTSSSNVIASDGQFVLFKLPERNQK